MSWLSKAAKKTESNIKSTISQPLNVVKKVAEVNLAGAEGVVTGFATGGVKGAIAGGITAGVVAIKDVGSTHEGASLGKIATHAAEAGGAAGFATGLFSTAFSGAPVSERILPAAKNGLGGIGSFVSKGLASLKAGGIVALGAALLSGKKSSGDQSSPNTDQTTPYAPAGPNSVNVTLPGYYAGGGDGSGGGGGSTDFSAGPSGAGGRGSAFGIIPILLAVGLAFVLLTHKRRIA